MKTMAQDYYKTLGVSKSATQDEIQKAYRKLARQYHPDLNPDDKAAQQKFKEIQHAYDVLSEPEKRDMYDQLGPDFEKMGPGGGGNPFAGGQGFEQIFGGAGPGGFQFDGDLGDLFRQFGGAGGPGGGRARSAPPSKGRDLTSELTVPFSTAVLGGQASITVMRAGKPESIQLKIPPGVDTGKKMRLRGQGEPGPRGGAAGDLIVTLTVASHPFFKRSGSNLELRLPVTVGEAAFGATVDVPTPNGKVALKIPAGSGSGKRLRIKGQGVFSPSGPPGDLFVELQLKLPDSCSTPDTMSDQTKQAIEHIEQLYQASPRSSILW
ncbi:MAG: J domain-containing protein [Pirellulaceae bacterium]